jgi:hypothetical protein
MLKNNAGMLMGNVKWCGVEESSLAIHQKGKHHLLSTLKAGLKQILVYHCSLQHYLQ